MSNRVDVSGPYRGGHEPQPPAGAGTRLVFGVIGLSIAGAVVALVWPRQQPHLTVLDVPRQLVDDTSSFPSPEMELPIATPLAPLLSTQDGETLRVVVPDEGTTRLIRGEHLTVVFNRPMVRASEVGIDLATSPIVFARPVRGTTRWSRRNQLQFTPAPREFDAMREVTFTVAGITSVEGEVLEDDEYERILRCDGTPHIVGSDGEAIEGAPLRLWFDAPPNLGELSSQMFAYEQSAGRRGLGFSLSAGERNDRGVGVDVTLNRSLPAGTRVGVALSPQWVTHSSGYPDVRSFEFAPTPRIDGIDCTIIDDGSLSCSYESEPGDIIDIGESLVLHASHLMSEPSVSDVTVTPPLAEQTVTLGAADARDGRRTLIVGGLWEPDQTYQVTIGGLRTANLHPMRAPGPLAVRSRGHAPYVAAPSGELVFENDVTVRVPFRAINATGGFAFVREVARGDEANAWRRPASYVHDNALRTSLEQLAPEQSPNRWGTGRVAVAPRMAVVGFDPEPGDEREPSVVFVQRTDLGMSALALPTGLLVSVRSLSTGAPVASTALEVQSDVGVVGRAETGADGVAFVAFVPGQHSAIRQESYVVAVSGEDRALLRVTPALSLSPTSLGLDATGEALGEGDVHALVVSDRGIYRPGETVRVMGSLRRVEGPEISVPVAKQVRVELWDPGAEAPLRTELVTPDAHGVLSTQFTLPDPVTMGEFRVELRYEGEGTATLGGRSIEVADYREPRIRVDVERARAANGDALVHTGDSIEVPVRAAYLFGVPLARARGTYSLRRVERADHGRRWSRFVFQPDGTRVNQATLAEGALTLDDAGRAVLTTQALVDVATRTRLDVVVDVRDELGDTAHGTASFVALPGDVEVGVESGSIIQAIETPVSLRAVAVGADDAPIVGHPIAARVIREGWAGYWEWAGGADEGAFQLRRAPTREQVHACELVSAEEPVACETTVDRPGTYLLEAEVRDAAGRVVIASRRVYVAGPEGAPDRDPPGAPIAVTLDAERVSVGEDIVLAFESPFAEGDALVVVSREGAIERRSIPVHAGGQIVRIPSTDAMVPAAQVTVTLTRHRSAAPRGPVDLGAPDLRFGAARVEVRPRDLALGVTVESPTERVPSGENVSVGAVVRDAAGQPVAGVPVLLWAVDEGTLRITRYQSPDPMRALFPRVAPLFLLDDLRRSLTSRVAGALEAAISGDGNEEGEHSMLSLDARERYEPTIVFAPTLVTDAAGRVTTNVVPPSRSTGYRVMALALADDGRAGRGEGSLEVTDAYIVRPLLPGFVTAGDHIEAAVAVRAERVSGAATLRWSLDGRELGTGSIEIPPGEERILAVPFDAPSGDVARLAYDVTVGDVTRRVERTLDVVPRARIVRSSRLVGGDGERVVEIEFPEGVVDADLAVEVATHPFVGLADDARTLARIRADDTATLAAIVRGLVAWRALEAGRGRAEVRDEAIETALQRATGLLVARVELDGIAPHPTAGTSTAATLDGAEALLVAHEAGLNVSDRDVARVMEALVQRVNSGSFGYEYGRDGEAQLARALSVLRRAGTSGVEMRRDAAYARREFAWTRELAWTARAFPVGDERRAALLTASLERAMPSLRPAPDAGAAAAPASGEIVDYDGLFAVLPVMSESARPDSRLSRVISAALAAPRHDGAEAIAVRLEAFASVARALSPADAAPPTLRFDDAAVELTDGRALGGVAHFDFATIGHGHHRLVASSEGTPVFLALSTRYAMPLETGEASARGAVVALHRVLETMNGQRIADGASVPVGTMLRVRLFAHFQGSDTQSGELRDPHFAGANVVESSGSRTMEQAVRTMFDIDPRDSVYESRSELAVQSAWQVSRFAHDAHASTFALRGGSSSALREITYVVVATVPGRYLAPPAEFAVRGHDVLARSASTELTIVPPAPSEE